MLDKIGGWFVAIYAVFLIISMIIIPSIISTSPSVNVTFLNFYTSKAWHPFLVLFIGVGAYFVIGRSILPIGQYDPDRYPLQMFGYEAGFVISLIFGILLMGFWYNTVSTTMEVFIPVPRILTPSFQQVSANTRDFLSGTDPIGNALTSSILPTAYENPVLLYVPMMIVWLVVSSILITINVPKFASNIIGMTFGVLTVGIIFAWIAHAFAYQENQPAYNKAIFFTTTCAVPTALTGFPMPCDMAHIGHNWSASMLPFQTFVSVIAPLTFFIFLAVRKDWLTDFIKILKFKLNYFNLFNIGKTKINIDNMKVKISTFLVVIMLAGLFSIPSIARASIIDDIFNFFNPQSPLSTSSGFTTLSVSKVDMMSKDPTGTLSGEVYALQIATGGYGNLGQYAYTGSTNAFEEINVDGKPTKYDAKIDVKSLKQEARYTINDKSQGDQSVVTYHIVECGWLLPTTQECMNKVPSGGVYVGTIRPSGTIKYYTVYYKPMSIGVYNLPERPKILSQVKVSMTREDGSVIDGIVDNYENPWTRLDNSGVAVFTGGLKLYDEPPQAVQSNIKVTSTGNERNWYLIDGNKYNEWLREQQGMSDQYYWYDLGTNLGKGLEFIEQKMDYANSLAYRAVSKIDWENGNFDGSDYVINVDDKIYMNNLVIYVKSDWLGIYTPVSNVVISKIEKSDFQVGNEGIIKVYLNNIGDERASANVGVRCEDFTTTVSSKTVTIYPDSQEFVTLKVASGQIDSKECDKCTVYARTLISEVEKSIEICANPSDIVEPYKPPQPPIGEGNLENCYYQAEQNLPVLIRENQPLRTIFSVPQKMTCLWQEKKANIVMGILSLIFVIVLSVVLFKNPWFILGGIVVGLILLILSVQSLPSAIALLLLSFGALIFIIFISV